MKQKNKVKRLTKRQEAFDRMMEGKHSPPVNSFHRPGSVKK